MCCLDPLGSVEIRNGSAHGHNPALGIWVQGKFRNGGLEQIAPILVQSPGLEWALGSDLLSHVGQSRAGRLHFPLRRAASPR